MFIADNLKLATRNFRTRGLRTFLTILGISVGIGTTLFLVSLGYGLQNILLEKIVRSDALLTLDVMSANPSIIKIDKKTLEDFSRIGGVSEVSPQQVIMSQSKAEDITSSVQFSAVNSSFFRLGGIEILHGKKYENDNATEVVLSTGALTSLGIDDFSKALGKEIEVTLVIPAENQGDKQDLLADKKMIPLEQKFTICGVVDGSSESSGFIPSSWVSSSTPDYFDEVKIKTSSRENLDLVKNEMTDRGFSVIALTDTVDEANKIFSAIQVILSMFGVVALAVSAIGMFNTMTISLLERTNEIGILRAIGATEREVLFLFLTESIVIGFLGGIGGVAIGFLGTYLFNFGFNFLAEALGGQAISIFHTPFWFVAFITIFSTIVGLVTGIYPAIRASKLNPLVALRYK